MATGKSAHQNTTSQEYTELDQKKAPRQRLEISLKEALMSWWSSLLIFIVYVYISITIFYLLLDNRETATTLSWLLVFIFFPIGGIVIYFLVGRGMRKKVGQTLVRQNLENRMQDIHQTILEQQQLDMSWIAEKYSLFEHKKLMKLLYRNSDSILTRNTDIQIFFEGRDKFNVLLDDLSSANSHIYMEYFIWKSDALSARVVEVLKQKIAQGVDVRILYDSIGNYLSKRYQKKLRRLGIKIYPYYNFQSPFKIHTLNYRNHRKIVVIDGTIGYIGGMNMGNEYIDGGESGFYPGEIPICASKERLLLFFRKFFPYPGLIPPMSLLISVRCPLSAKLGIIYCRCR